MPKEQQVKKFYHQEKRDGPYTFTYLRWGYTINSVEQVKSIRREIAKDFSGVEDTDIFLSQKSTHPFEIALSFTIPKRKVDMMKNLERDFEQLPEGLTIGKMKRRTSLADKIVRSYRTADGNEFIIFYQVREEQSNAFDITFKRLIKRIKREYRGVDEGNIIVEIYMGVVTLAFARHKSELDVERVKHSYHKMRELEEWSIIHIMNSRIKRLSLLLELQK